MLFPTNLALLQLFKDIKPSETVNYYNILKIIIKLLVRVLWPRKVPRKRFSLSMS
jgi:hypothetical protein